MSYQTGSATDLDDLMSKLSTFLTGTPGWTEYLFNGTNRRAVWGKPTSPETMSRLVQFQWDNASGYLGNALIGGYVGDVTWEQQSNCEFTTGIITSCRYSNEMTGPFPSYHFFENDTYCHVVVEISSGLYRHFGFGNAYLLGGLKGGAYATAEYINQSASYIDDPGHPQHSMPWDGGNVSNTTRGSTIHVTGVTQVRDPNTKYFRHTTNSNTLDDDGDYIGPLMCSGFRDGPHTVFMSSRSSDLNGFKPLIPIALFSANFYATPDVWTLLGYIPDMRNINLYGLTVGQEITVGADTWVVFPINRKGNNGLSYNQEQSYNFGYAYKKVTT